MSEDEIRIRAIRIVLGVILIWLIYRAGGG